MKTPHTKIPFFFADNIRAKKITVNNKAEQTNRPLNPRKLETRLVRLRIGDLTFRVVSLLDISRLYGFNARTIRMWVSKEYIPKPAYSIRRGGGHAGVYLHHQGYYLMQAINTLLRQHENCLWKHNPHVVDELFRKYDKSLHNFRRRAMATGKLDVQDLLDRYTLEEVAEILDG